MKPKDLVEGAFNISLAGGYATDFPDFREHWFLGTVSLTLFDRLGPFYTFDGINSHLGASLFAKEWLTLTAYALELAEPAVSIGIRWPSGNQ